MYCSHFAHIINGCTSSVKFEKKETDIEEKKKILMMAGEKIVTERRIKNKYVFKIEYVNTEPEKVLKFRLFVNKSMEIFELNNITLQEIIVQTILYALNNKEKEICYFVEQKQDIVEFTIKVQHPYLKPIQEVIVLKKIHLPETEKLIHGTQQISNCVKITPFDVEYQNKLIDAISVLQNHEHQISSTILPASPDLCMKLFQLIKEECNQKHGKIFIGLVENEFAGFIAYHFESEEEIFKTPQSNHFAFISNICVLSKFRHLGIGQQLLLTVEQDIRLHGFLGYLQICALANNNLATSAYERFGFEPYEVLYQKRVT